MDETTYHLTPERFAEIDSEPDEETLFLLRCIQSSEALELGGRSEEELVDLLEWYHQVQTDFMLIEMVMRGDIYIGEGSEGEYTFAITPQGADRARATAIARGEEIPDWAEQLPSLD